MLVLLISNVGCRVGLELSSKVDERSNEAGKVDVILWN
jgi:hypothetical protein